MAMPETIEAAHCWRCGSGINVLPCTSCGVGCCPDHRVGSGSVSEGYTCGLICLRDDIRPLPAPKSARQYARYGVAFYVIVGLAVGVAWFLVMRK